MTAGRLNAAPQDIRGSDNVAVASYTTNKGTYLLWSSGRITNSETGQVVAPPYQPATGFQKAPVVAKMPAGSPNVAVDYVQNDKGTFTLFADGNVMKADDEGASAPLGSSNVLFAARLRNGVVVEDGIRFPTVRSAVFPDLAGAKEFSDGGLLLIPVSNPYGPEKTSTLTLSIEPGGRVQLPHTAQWTGDWAIAVGK